MAEANETLREEELLVVRSIYGVCHPRLRGLLDMSLTGLQDDWHDIPPVKTKWGTELEGGWWGVTVRAEEGRVSVQVRGRMSKVCWKVELTPYLVAETTRNIQISRHI
jgi:translation initiation factor 2-alpha kinase 4